MFRFIVCAVCIFVFVRNVNLVESINPGICLQISENGLNYASTIAVDLLSQTIMKMPLPYIKGKSKQHHVKIEYELSNMAITSFGKPITKVTIVPGKEVKWKVAGASLSIGGHWRIKWRYHFVHKTDHGNFKVSASGINFSLGVTLGIDKNNRPTISATSCMAEVGHVKAKFSGSHLSWLYNLFDKQVAKMIQKQLQKMICQKAQQAININGEKKLSKMKVLTKIGRYMELDYGLVSPPNFGKQYLQTSHKGEVYFRGKQTEAPFPAPPILSEVTGSKMLYIRMSDYILNTMGYVANAHGILKHYLTAKELPVDKRAYLNTTCNLICIGRVIPQLKKVPDASVEIGMHSSVTPRFSIGPSGISGNMTGCMDFNGRKPDGSVVPLFSTLTTMNFSFNSSVKHGNVTAFVKTLKYSFHVTKSEVGKIPDQALTAVLQFLSDNFIKKAINDVAGVGIPIPNLDDIQLMGPEIKFEKGTLRIGADVRYTPPKSNSVLLFETQNVQDPISMKKNI